jgi:hypothetical protein
MFTESWLAVVRDGDSEVKEIVLEGLIVLVVIFQGRLVPMWRALVKVADRYKLI